MACITSNIVTSARRISVYKCYSRMLVFQLSTCSPIFSEPSPIFKFCNKSQPLARWKLLQHLLDASVLETRPQTSISNSQGFSRSQLAYKEEQSTTCLFHINQYRGTDVPGWNPPRRLLCMTNSLVTYYTCFALQASPLPEQAWSVASVV